MAYRPFPSFWMFRDRDGRWRWNFASADGKVIAASKVAYFHKEGCVRAILTIKGSSSVPVWGPERDVEDVGNDRGAPQEQVREMVTAQ